MPGGHGLRVLVVDDAEDMRTLLRRWLERRGYQVDVAGTLEQARARDPGSYDAVVVDILVGAECGLDLIDDLRSRGPGAVARCLVISGGFADELPAGVASLTKPFDGSELTAAVRAITGDPGPPVTPPAGPRRLVTPARPRRLVSLPAVPPGRAPSCPCRAAPPCRAA